MPTENREVESTNILSEIKEQLSSSCFWGLLLLNDHHVLPGLLLKTSNLHPEGQPANRY